MARIVVGTGTGVVELDPGSAGVTARHLEGREVRALAPESWERLWAVVGGDEIWRSSPADGWQRVATLDGAGGDGPLTAHCLADTRANAAGGILVGTSRAHLVRVAPDGAVAVVQGFDQAPGREDWYTPWGAPADTRTISEDGESVYVNVHVGGVLRSRDEGATWAPTIDVDADVHRVVTGCGRVYAAGANGLSVSEDGGERWRLVGDGLHARYCRSVAVCGETLLLSASTGPSSHRAAVYRSGVDPQRFERCTAGLPEWFEGNIDSLCLDALPDGTLAALGSESGEVFASTDSGSSWSPVAGGLHDIRCVLTLP